MIKVAVAQMRCRLGDLAHNSEKIADFVKRAAEDQCRIVVLPEISDVGYETSAIKKHAATWSELPYETAARAAKEHGLYVVCGLSEKTDLGTFNTAAVIDPSGNLLTKYRKTHLFSPAPVEEHKVFRAGDDLVTAEIDGVTFGFTICFDLRFPELYRSLTLKGATVLVNCTAWPASRTAHWTTLTQARAIENQAYFLGANRVGSDGGMTFCGHSIVVSPFGEVICEANAEDEDLLFAELDSEEVRTFREKIPVLQCRRTDVYELE